ncbi:hypothetical protein GF312_13745, partial [Candidatus Poribacteria bacterium]|nr:hypothetical protein [Candidatus Poribacteria bacterium]
MRKNYHDGSGKLIGYTVENGRRTDCYNANGVYLGYVVESGTHDATGYRISINPIPGLLFRNATDK